MDVLSSRSCAPRPADRDRSRRFYRDALGLAVCREFGDRDDPGVVFFLGGGHLELSGAGDGTSARNSPSGYRSGTSLPNTGAFRRRVLRSCVHPNGNRGVLARRCLASPHIRRRRIPIVLVEELIPAHHPLGLASGCSPRRLSRPRPRRRWHCRCCASPPCCLRVPWSRCRSWPAPAASLPRSCRTGGRSRRSPGTSTWRPSLGRRRRMRAWGIVACRVLGAAVRGHDRPRRRDLRRGASASQC